MNHPTIKICNSNLIFALSLQLQVEGFVAYLRLRNILLLLHTELKKQILQTKIEGKQKKKDEKAQV